MSAVNLAPRVTSTQIEYPESDGQPMAETDVHIAEMINLILALKEYFRDDPQVYVAGNLFVYYAEGDPSQVVAPDVFVVFGIAKHNRRIYKTWEEGKPPAVVIEITSSSTRRQDREEKRLLYESLGVSEFFLFDPLGDYLKPPLRGFRLVGEYYIPLEPQPFAQGNWQLRSQVLSLELHAESGHLRLFNSVAGRYLLSPAEQAQARRDAEARAAQAETRATQAETRAAQAETRAAQEAEARRQAETEIERLKTELRRLKPEE